MAGVPSSRGCNACRIAKKKCDETKPACSRCTRLKVRCIGGGVKRYVFKSENVQQSRSRLGKVVTTNTAWPTPALSSVQTRIASALVFMLETKDLRYDLCTYGQFVLDLPRHVGSSPVLDASFAALIASFNSLRSKELRPQALARYGDLLTKLRSSINDPKQSSMAENMCAIYLLSIFQEWVDHEHSGTAKHIEMLVHLLREFAATDPNMKTPFGSDLLITLCSSVVIESFSNANIDLGPWFWDLLNAQGSRRPLRAGSGQIFTTVGLEAIADISCILRDPKRYLLQIRSTYSLLQLEYPRLRQAVREAIKGSEVPGATMMTRRISHRFLVTYGALLSLSSLLSRVIRVYTNEPSLLISAYDFRAEAIWVGRKATVNRPLASSFAPEALKIVRATMSDVGYCSEVEELLLEYQQDFEGARYIKEAQWIQQRFEAMERRQAQLAFGAQFDAAADFLGEQGACNIL